MQRTTTWGHYRFLNIYYFIIYYFYVCVCYKTIVNNVNTHARGFDRRVYSAIALYTQGDPMVIRARRVLLKVPVERRRYTYTSKRNNNTHGTPFSAHSSSSSSSNSISTLTTLLLLHTTPVSSRVHCRSRFGGAPTRDV